MPSVMPDFGDGRSAAPARLFIEWSIPPWISPRRVVISLFIRLRRMAELPAEKRGPCLARGTLPTERE